MNFVRFPWALFIAPGISVGGGEECDMASKFGRELVIPVSVAGALFQTSRLTGKDLANIFGPDEGKPPDSPGANPPAFLLAMSRVDKIAVKRRLLAQAPVAVWI